MKTQTTVGVCLVCATLLSPILADAAVTSVVQFGSNLDPIPPQIETSLLGEESFGYVDRTHELTSARFTPATGLLTTDATGTLAGFPSYLLGLQYVANANDNRVAGDVGNASSYRVTYTVNAPSIAYLLLDNRLNGGASNATSNPNTVDPNLGGTLSWVVSDGWKRVNTGIMPNGQADFLGIDEGATVAGPADRTHHDPGAGAGLNNFFSIYSKPVSGTFDTFSIRQATGSGNMYIVAIGPVPEPSTMALLGLGAATALGWSWRRRRLP